MAADVNIRTNFVKRLPDIGTVYYLRLLMSVPINSKLQLTEYQLPLYHPAI